MWLASHVTIHPKKSFNMLNIPKAIKLKVTSIWEKINVIYLFFLIQNTFASWPLIFFIIICIFYIWVFHF